MKKTKKIKPYTNEFMEEVCKSFIEDVASVSEFLPEKVNNMEINIFGEEWDILTVSKDSMDDEDNYGECDRWARVIRINKDLYSEDDTTDNTQECMAKVLRHEVFHAIFHEIGLECYAEDEILVDALAVIYPKIDKIMEQLVH